MDQRAKRRIEPGRAGGPVRPRFSARGNPALREWAEAGLEAPDFEVIQGWRLGRLRRELERRGLAAAVLLDPVNIRYATDCSNMQVFCMHNTVRYVFVAADGPVVLFEAAGCEHLAASATHVDEIRPAVPMSYFDSGSNEADCVARWAGDIAGLVQAYGQGNRGLAIDRMPPAGMEALARHGIDAIDGYGPTEHARAGKHPEEVKAMRRAIHAAETGLGQMWQALEPGYTTENELWSWLHQANIARGGEWIETRLLASGPRTNPWFHECSDRVIEPGDLVAFDTDMVGPYGLCADISRSWVAGSAPTAEQQELHAIALEHIEENARLLRPGLDLRELSENSHRLPPECRANRYPCLIHGIGLCDEYPAVRYPEDWAASGYDGCLEAGMTVCVEAYVGREGGREGVKLERQGLITDTGIEFLDRFPLELKTL